MWKFSISNFLVSALGMVLFFKAFVYVLEHYVLQVTGTPELKVDESYCSFLEYYTYSGSLKEKNKTQ